MTAVATEASLESLNAIVIDSGTIRLIKSTKRLRDCRSATTSREKEQEQFYVTRLRMLLESKGAHFHLMNSRIVEVL
jgi:hypothetical protein